MNKLLIIIDMQNDFTYGALANPDAVAVIEPILRKAEAFDGRVIFTKDTHTQDYGSTQEGRKLPVPHCIQGTEGWELVPPLEALRRKLDSKVYCKPTFGCVQLAREIEAQNAADPFDSIELVGVCTDICVISNAMLIKAAVPEVTVAVDAACCAGVTPESHKTALAAMAACQIEIR